MTPTTPSRFSRMRRRSAPPPPVPQGQAGAVELADQIEEAAARAGCWLELERDERLVAEATQILRRTLAELRRLQARLERRT